MIVRIAHTGETCGTRVLSPGGARQLTSLRLPISPAKDHSANRTRTFERESESTCSLKEKEKRKTPLTRHRGPAEFRFHRRSLNVVLSTNSSASKPSRFSPRNRVAFRPQRCETRSFSQRRPLVRAALLYLRLFARHRTPEKIEHRETVTHFTLLCHCHIRRFTVETIVLHCRSSLITETRRLLRYADYCPTISLRREERGARCRVRLHASVDGPPLEYGTRGAHFLRGRVRTGAALPLLVPCGSRLLRIAFPKCSLFSLSLNVLCSRFP